MAAIPILDKRAKLMDVMRATQDRTSRGWRRGSPLLLEGICEKPRIKCTDCLHQRFLAITDETFPLDSQGGVQPNPFSPHRNRGRGLQLNLRRDALGEAKRTRQQVPRFMVDAPFRGSVLDTPSMRDRLRRRHIWNEL